MRFGDDIGAYEIESLPGSPQCAISLRTFVYPEKRNKGEGQKQHTARLRQLENLAYDYVLATANLSNVKEVHILIKNGWKQLDSFVSSSTGHTVGIFGRPISRQKQP